jgi:hypothetical protein
MKLLALKCPVCGQRLDPQNNQVVVMECGQCDTAVSIDPDAGVSQTTVQYAQGKENAEAWLPLWVFDAQVNITSRKTQKRDGRSEQDSHKLWGSPRQLCVPAWTLEMQTARQLGTKLIETPPQLQATAKPNGVIMAEMIVAQEDALKLIEFIVLSIEAERKDWLTDLQFDIKTQATQLWIVPARQNRGQWQLLI